VEIKRHLCAHCKASRPFLEERCGRCGGFRTVYIAGVDKVPDRIARAGDELPREVVHKIPTGLEPLDEALTGGFVMGSSVLLYGAGGSRKTTIAGAAAQRIAAATRRPRALYVSAEEPSAEARNAAERLGPVPLVAYLGTDVDGDKLARVRAEVERLRPAVVVYDSIQEFDAPIVAVIKRARRDALTFGHVAILISQVNARGVPMGPTKSIHGCSTVLELTLERIRVVKSRHGRSVTVDVAGRLEPVTVARRRRLPRASAEPGSASAKRRSATRARPSE
jgi:predicted ATP-dependent serine protease